MNRWQKNRKRLIFLIVVLALLILVGLPLYFFFYQAPTCSDDKRNSDETGIDCGGSCQRLCAPESLPLVLRGDPRVLQIATTSFEIVAIVENPNAAEIKRAKYDIQIYAGAIPIESLEGELYIPASSKFAVFEGPFHITSGRVPTRATLEWQEESLLWEKSAKTSLKIRVKSTSFSRLLPPRLEAWIENLSLDGVSNIDLTVLVSDKDGNIFAASKTLIDSIPPRGEMLAVFSWPRPFLLETASTEVLVKILPSRSLR
ncbi:MAG TPA: hypothetical protein VJJ48_02310 [Candidatus Paceibacterota bacterium]